MRSHEILYLSHLWNIGIGPTTPFYWELMMRGLLYISIVCYQADTQGYFEKRAQQMKFYLWSSVFEFCVQCVTEDFLAIPI